MKRLIYWSGIVVKKLWMSIALLLVSFAVLISLVRISLPYVDSQKSFITQWASNKFAFDVELARIEAGWNGLDPTIVLVDLALSDQQGPVALTIPKTEVEIDFWASLRQLDIVANRFTLQGMDIYLGLDQSSGNQDKESEIKALEDLFLKRLQHFSVRDSQLYLTHDREQRPIFIETLTWFNRGERHQGKGVFKVDDLTQDSLDFVLDLHDSEDGLRGLFYSKAQGVDISPWFSGIVNPKTKSLMTDANFSLWATLENRQISSVILDLQPTTLSLSDKQTDQTTLTKLLAGQLVLIPDNGQWLFSVEDLVVSNGLGELSNLHVNGNISTAQTFTVALAKPLNIAPLVQLAEFFLSDTAYSQLTAISPQLYISNGFAARDVDRFYSHIGFTDLSIKENQNVPGIEGLSGEVFWSGLQGRVKLQSHHGQIALSNYLDEPIELYELQLDSYVVIEQGGLKFSAPTLLLDTDKITLEGELAYDTTSQYLITQLKLNDIGIDTAKTLLTPAIIGKKPSDFLTQALVRGNISDGKILWNGRMSDFPFNDKQGVFQAATQLQGFEFSFDPRWPNVSDTNVNVLFENEGLVAQSDYARLLTTQGTDIHATIDRLHVDSVVQLTAKARDSGQGAARLVNNSTLKASLGGVMTQVVLTGPLESLIDIRVPLSGKAIKVKGDVTLKDNDVFVTSLNLPIKGLSGEFTFENEKIFGEGIQGQVFEQPTQFSFDGEQGDRAYQAKVKLSGHWQLDPMIEQHLPPLQPYIDGIANWRGNLDLSFPKDGFNYQFQLNSDLPQVVMNFPAPLAKKSGIKQRLRMTSAGDAIGSDVRILLGDDVQFNGQFSHADIQFSNAFLTVGKRPAWQPYAGFNISVDVQEISLEPWYDAIFSVINQSNSKYSILSAPESVIVKSDKVLMANQTFHNGEITAENGEQSWQIEFNAKEARAQADVYHDLNNRGLDVNVAFLNLPSLNTGGESTLYTDEFSLPPVSFQCQQCIIEQANLGNIQVDLVPNTKGMHIERLIWDSRFGLLSAQGDWLTNKQGSQTQLTGKFTTDDFGAFLQDLKQDMGIRDSGTDMSFDLNWGKAPHQFEIASLNGQIKWELDDGHLSEISDKGVRILSLFSLDSLVRKLALDFRDVFSKGFFYNGMEGDFDIKNGVVTTDNTEIDGVAGDMVLTGFTDLNNQNINYQIGFRPKVTSSLPLIMAWLVNPATGLAALAFDEVITSAKVVSSLEYSLTGSLNNPVLSEIDRQSEDVPLPAQVLPEESGIESVDESILEEKTSG